VCSEVFELDGRVFWPCEISILPSHPLYALSNITFSAHGQFNVWISEKSNFIQFVVLSIDHIDERNVILFLLSAPRGLQVLAKFQCMSELISIKKYEY
jgi:hypothetical protein